MEMHEKVEEEKIERIFREFTGEIFQKPPLKASVKREVRKRWIYKIDLLEIEHNRVLFKVACQAGTYIRKLCSDMGEVIGSGAHMRELRRTRAGPFNENRNLFSLYDLVYAQEKYRKECDEKSLREIVRPMEEAFEYIPKIYVKDSAVDAICHGAYLAAPGVSKIDSEIKPRSPVVLFTLKGEAVALARCLISTEDIMEAEKGIVGKTVRVVMAPGTYPSLWKKRREEKVTDATN
jgi:H/ACA ribonucleoprotein complex subunit 4